MQSVCYAEKKSYWKKSPQKNYLRLSFSDFANDLTLQFSANDDLNE